MNEKKHSLCTAVAIIGIALLVFGPLYCVALELPFKITGVVLITGLLLFIMPLIVLLITS